MAKKFPSRKRLRRIVFGLLLVVVAVVFSGCHTMRFYTQAIKGQYQLLAHQQPIDKLLADPATSDRLRARLEVVQQLRAFADTELKLPVDGHYKKYVDLHRPYVVWNVEAAHEFSMEPKTWWYPFLGSLKYRGYFSKQAATNYADSLRNKGLDVYTGGVAAYSTLGWFKDPLLNTFIFTADADLAEILFHELAHQRVFARGDTDFNEAFATTVGQEGARRWLKARHDAQALNTYTNELEANGRFVEMVMTTRHRLETLFGDKRTPEGRVKATNKNRDVPLKALRREKTAILGKLRQEYFQHKEALGAGYERWFTNNLNNAKLNSVAAYYELVPAFSKLLEIDGADLEKFYGSAQRLADMDRKHRHEWLTTIAQSTPADTTNHLWQPFGPTARVP